MKKKVFCILCMMLLAVQFASATRYAYMIYNSGELMVFPFNKVVVDDNPFTITSEVTDVKDSEFTVSFNVGFKSSKYKTLGKEGLNSAGILISDTNKNPTFHDSRREGDLWKIGQSTVKVEHLNAATTYYYRPFYRVNENVEFYGETKSVTTTGTKPEYIDVEGHDFVDLGLPSGLLWAACNVGASKPAQIGKYFAWGETTSKRKYEKGTYKYMAANGSITKYNSTDKKTTLDAEDDAAYVNWGPSFSTPTPDDFKELIDNCTWTTTRLRTPTSCTPVYGYKVTSKTNGNWIFFPFGGYLMLSGLNLFDKAFGFYWSNTLTNEGVATTLYLKHFWGEASRDLHHTNREHGCPVRPVTKKKVSDASE